MSASTESATWVTLERAIDVPADSSRLELSLEFRGLDAACADLQVVIDQPAQIAVIAPTIGVLRNVAILARAAALIRYRHPSDESSALDWDDFLVRATDRVVAMRSDDLLISKLREIFAPIAPTVQFAEDGAFEIPARPSAAFHLTRWYRIGLGNTAPYTAWRMDRDTEHAELRVETLLALANMSQCSRGHLRALVGRTDSTGEASIYIDMGQAGRNSKLEEKQISDHDSELSMEFDVPRDVVDARVGIKLKGKSGVQLRSISVHCDNGSQAVVDAASALWERQGHETLYDYRVDDVSGSRRLVVRRRPPQTEIVASRDVVHVELAPRLWMHMPVVAWTDGEHTLPQRKSGDTPSVGHTIADLPVRLSIVASAWGTLWLFYPYFGSQHIDWEAELERALVSASATNSTHGMYECLLTMLAALRDNHARAYHQAIPNDGILPIALRRAGDALIVTGTLDPGPIALGCEVTAIDGVPAMQAYQAVAHRTPAATSGWTEMIVPFWLTVGTAGMMADLGIKCESGTSTDILLPYLSRQSYEALIHEVRLASGSQLSTGVRYVDLDGLTAEGWNPVQNEVLSARVVIMDMRGYPTNAVFGILGQFSDKELKSPRWHIPVLGESGPQRLRWVIRPVLPRFGGKLIMLIDGRAVSAAETVLQIVKDNHLGILVGEPSAGTNGNVAMVALAAGFSFRFTAMRVLLSDGDVLQGRGIAPDVVVKPTSAGLRARRDEVLETAVEIANRL